MQRKSVLLFLTFVKPTTKLETALPAMKDMILRTEPVSSLLQTMPIHLTLVVVLGTGKIKFA